MLELFAQGAAVQPEHQGGSGLVVPGVCHDFRQEWRLDLRQHHLVHVGRGLPIQFIPSPSGLAREAIESAAEVDYLGVPVRVVRPEHLVALYLEPQARTRTRQERAAALLELPTLNHDLVNEILKRHGLSL